MKITVAICTWNRAKLLDQTLVQMAKLRIPEGVEWELLVVNNNSTDDTDDIIARHSNALPLRRLFEPKQGHSNARNCAVDGAQGELLIWTDDDVLVDPEWLAEYVQAATAWPDAAYFCGPIRPWYERPPAPWIQAHLNDLNGVFALAEGDATIRPMRQDESPVGANMAFRIRNLREHRFDPKFGRVAAELTSADEKDLWCRLSEQGLRGVWIGTASVTHFIPADRLALKYVWDWFRGAGRTAVRMGRYSDRKSFYGVPLWVWRRYWEVSLLELLMRPWKSAAWFQAFRASGILRGVIDERTAR